MITAGYYCTHIHPNQTIPCSSVARRDYPKLLESAVHYSGGKFFFIQGCTMFKRIIMSCLIITVLVIAPVFTMLIYAGMSDVYAVLFALCAGGTVAYFTAIHTC